MDDIFCEIIKHEIPASIRYEDDEFLAFDDINPKAKIHILVIPKVHISSVTVLVDKDQDMMGKLILVARDIAKKLDLDKTGYRLVLNSGKDAGQIVDHLHLHILGGNALGSVA